MSKHTPGPWRWEKFSGDYDSLMSNTGKVVSVGACYEADPWLVVTEPDARLIAATPELLEALRPFAKFVEMFDKQPLHVADTIYAIHTGTEWEAELRLSDMRAALAAIAKAETP